VIPARHCVQSTKCSDRSSGVNLVLTFFVGRSNGLGTERSRSNSRECSPPLAPSGFRLFWAFKSCNRRVRPNLASETIALIQRMAKENRLWGLNEFVVNSSRSASRLPSTQSRTILHVFAQPNFRRKPGLLSARITAERYGLETFYPSSTSDFVRSFSFSSSNWPRDAISPDAWVAQKRSDTVW
jgi:hypothetical protein